MTQKHLIESWKKFAVATGIIATWAVSDVKLEGANVSLGGSYFDYSAYSYSKFEVRNGVGSNLVPFVLPYGVTTSFAYSGTNNPDSTQQTRLFFGTKESDLPWGGVYSDTQSTGYFSGFIAQNGPINQEDGTPWTIDVTIDFSGTAYGHVMDLNFGLYGISNDFLSGYMNSDRLTLSALDHLGNPINIINVLSPYTATPTFTVTSLGNSALIEGANTINDPYGTGGGGGFDHYDPNTNLMVDFNNTAVSSITFTWAPETNGTGLGVSAGVALTDLNFEIATIPEPTSLILIKLSFMVLSGRRKRWS